MLVTHHVARCVTESIYPSLEIDGLNMIRLQPNAFSEYVGARRLPDQIAIQRQAGDFEFPVHDKCTPTGLPVETEASGLIDSYGPRQFMR